jgi:aminopeptidase N
LDITNLRVDSVVVEGSLRSGGSVYEIPMANPLPPGESVILEASFGLSLPLEMAGNYGLFGYHGGILLLQEFFPLLPVVDEDGWALETPPSHGDLTHLDASFFLVRIQAPRDLIIVSSGTALQHTTSGNSQILLQAAGPARDFYLAASMDFTSYSLDKDGITITNYATEADPETAREMLEIAASAFTIFNEQFGSYPYIEFDMIGTPMQALGMEYPGIIALASGLYDPQATILDLPSTVFLEGTVVHEVAHQWFYNVIGNDQVLHPWLDEAMAQYATGLYFRERYGHSAYQQFRDSWLSRWDRVERMKIPIGLATSGYDGHEYGAIVYGRGPLFIDKLETTMGQESFANFLSEYVEQLSWGISTPTAFQELAESACDCNLQGLFDEWVVEN